MKTLAYNKYLLSAWVKYFSLKNKNTQEQQETDRFKKEKKYIFCNLFGAIKVIEVQYLPRTLSQQLKLIFMPKQGTAWW